MEEDITKEFPQDEILKTILAELRSAKAQLTTIDNRLTTLEEKVDRRLMETRPIWESVLEQLKEINGRIDSLEKEYKDQRRTFRYNVAEITRDQEDIEERLEKLEDAILPRQ